MYDFPKNFWDIFQFLEKIMINVINTIRYRIKRYETFSRIIVDVLIRL